MDVFSAAVSVVSPKKLDLALLLHSTLCDELREESQKMADDYALLGGWQANWILAGFFLSETAKGSRYPRCLGLSLCKLK